METKIQTTGNTQTQINNMERISIDTVTLSISNHFTILPENSLQDIGNKRVSNPNAEDRKKGIYKPKVTVTNTFYGGHMKEYLILEFSVPKFLHNNNIQTVSKEDLPAIADKMSNYLLTIGIEIDPYYIMSATVNKVHFAKNIELPREMNITKALTEIYRSIERPSRLDLGHTTYINGGTAIRVRNTVEELVIYDKVKDFQQSVPSEKRFIGKEYYCEKDILKKVISNKIQILRFEYRLTDHTKIYQVLKDKNGRYSFNHIMGIEKWERILFEKWSALIKNFGNIPFDDKPYDLLLRTLGRDAKPNLTVLFSVIGWVVCAQEVGHETLMTMAKQYLTKTQLRYFSKKLAEDIMPLKQTNEVIEFINSKFSVYVNKTAVEAK